MSLIKTDDGSAAYYKYSCKYNEGVSCAPTNRHCDRCGFNPKIAEERLKKICDKHGITIPQPKRDE